MINKTETQRIMDMVMAHSAADETEATLASRNSALTRFAENVIHQNVEERDAGLTVRTILGQR
ncbi:MAG: hypothetical protein KAI38_07655, partial [Candidatus Latescibacteria bacterium]|nr:hypothetical protein [Candidatus Latescibacterota bacterium]